MCKRVCVTLLLGFYWRYGLLAGWHLLMYDYELSGAMTMKVVVVVVALEVVEWWKLCVLVCVVVVVHEANTYASACLWRACARSSACRLCVRIVASCARCGWVFKSIASAEDHTLVCSHLHSIDVYAAHSHPQIENLL